MKTHLLTALTAAITFVLLIWLFGDLAFPSGEASRQHGSRDQ